MKVVVTAKGRELTSPVESQFEHARYFILHDDVSREFAVYDALIGCPPIYDALITGSIDRKSLHSFQTAEVVIYVGATGTVNDALEQLKSGHLSCAFDPGMASEPAENTY